MTRRQDEDDEIQEPEQRVGRKTIRIKGQEYGCYNVYKMVEVGNKTEIYWTTKAGQAKKTTVLTDEIAQIDEDLEDVRSM